MWKRIRNVRNGDQATLKEMLIPVQRLGEYITAESWQLFFHFANSLFFFFCGGGGGGGGGKKQQKWGGGGELFAAARLATISATHWTGNHPFFKGGLMFNRICSRITTPGTTTPRTTTRGATTPRTITPVGQIPLCQLPTRTITHLEHLPLRTITPEDNYPHLRNMIFFSY